MSYSVERVYLARCAPGGRLACPDESGPVIPLCGQANVPALIRIRKTEVVIVGSRKAGWPRRSSRRSRRQP